MPANRTPALPGLALFYLGVALAVCATGCDHDRDRTAEPAARPADTPPAAAAPRPAPSAVGEASHNLASVSLRVLGMT